MALRGSGKTASGTHVGVVHVRSANDQRTSFVVVVVWFFCFFVVKLSTLRVGWFVMVMGDVCAVILTLHR